MVSVAITSFALNWWWIEVCVAFACLSSLAGAGTCTLNSTNSRRNKKGNNYMLLLNAASCLLGIQSYYLCLGMSSQAEYTENKREQSPITRLASSTLFFLSSQLRNHWSPVVAGHSSTVEVGINIRTIRIVWIFMWLLSALLPFFILYVNWFNGHSIPLVLSWSFVRFFSLTVVCCYVLLWSFGQQHQEGQNPHFQRNI